MTGLSLVLNPLGDKGMKRYKIALKEMNELLKDINETIDFQMEQMASMAKANVEIAARRAIHLIEEKENS